MRFRSKPCIILFYVKKNKNKKKTQKKQPESIDCGPFNK